MTDTRAVAPQPADRPAAGRERRRHHHLRDLIDEMLASLRAAANRDLFTPQERADAETQLAAIMERVHAEAVNLGGRPEHADRGAAT
ncbi:hypothetical protein J421_4972 (plasmid) [Gemmatirosa kalamazoonensis]|mgnify:CR=1 FL=1|jgi:hypothetical protein|uniref:Uncharacterized protein n=1 Tax=Gemmatirosa kalamazoonensis TaxID=861299 RepID=W0RPT8_9BACT|nr:hypothetical protein [Gemmatirosa kalamazoonensis]AHG92507.1 hypothetical protein J421_4972 [Gemmatirosa kalamazoonensis]